MLQAKFEAYLHKTHASTILNGFYAMATLIGNTLVKTLKRCSNFCKIIILTLSWYKSLSYRNQSTDFQSKSIDWLLYDTDLRHE